MPPACRPALLSLRVARRAVLAAASAGVLLGFVSGCDTAGPGANGGEGSGDARGADVAAPGAVPRGAQRAVVVRIVDGDTLVVRAAAKGRALASTSPVTVRLLEIDTPETKKPNTPVECYGREATAFTERLVPEGSSVWVLADEDLRDRFGRVLLYLWTGDGRFVNREIVRSGHARAVLFEPNDAYIDTMRAAEREAHAARRGLWSACAG